VEDEQALRVLTRELLESLGYTVLEARDGSEALALIASHEGRIDLLLTDLIMPGIDGEELARHIASRRPDTRILFVSGYSEDDRIRERLPKSRVRFLQKPYSASALGTSIRQLLDGT
jgi:CheY-like chemotaxis protein